LHRLETRAHDKQSILENTIILDNRPYTFDRVFRLGLAVGLLLGLVWLLSYLSDVLVPFAVAFLLAYLLNPIVNKVQAKIQNRAAAVAVTLCGLLAVFVLFCALFIPVIAGELKRMGDLATKIVKDVDFSTKLEEYVPAEVIESFKLQASKEELFKLLKEEKVYTFAVSGLRKILPGAWGIFTGTASFLLGLVGLVVIVLYLIFLLMDFQRAKDEWRNLVPPFYQDSLWGFMQEFDRAMSRHFRAQAVVAFLVGVLFAIGFALIGLPMGVLLGLFVGLLNMVPYLQIAGMLPAGLLAVMKAVESGDSVWGILGLTLMIFIVVQLIQDAILTPKIMGEVTGLSPAMILLSISIWGKLLGFLGLVIALPMTCLSLAYYNRIIESIKWDEEREKKEAVEEAEKAMEEGEEKSMANDETPNDE